MQTRSNNHNEVDTSVDAEELSRARQLWRNFTLFIKWGIVTCALVLLLLVLIAL